MITSRQQNLAQHKNIVIENLSLENVEKLRYLGVTVTNTNDISEEIKRRIHMGNMHVIIRLRKFYHSV